MEVKIRTADEFRNQYAMIEIKGPEKAIWTITEKLFGETPEPKSYDPEQAAEVLAENYRRASMRITELEAQVGAYDLDRRTERERADRLTAEVESYRKAHVCTAGCKEDAHVAFTGNRMITEMASERDTQRERAQEAEAQLVQARRARDEHAAEADRMNRERMAAQAEVRRLTAQLHQRFTPEQVQEAKESARQDARAEADRDWDRVIKERDRELTKTAEEADRYARVVGRISQIVLTAEVRQALDNPSSIAPVRAEELARVVRQVRDIVGTPGNTPNAA